MTTTNGSAIGSTTLGYARIGRDRELKRDVEAYWRGASGVDVLRRTAEGVRLGHLYTASTAGLDSSPVNTFSWYDHVLDAAVLVGAVPERYEAVSSDDEIDGFDAARYYAMARGNADVAPLEMTKWFDTNYHYLVPEIGPGTTFRLHPDKVLAELAEAAEHGVEGRPVLVGPYTFLALAKAPADADGGSDGSHPLDRLDDLVEVYVELLGRLADAGASWVQLDEPAVVRDLDPATVERVRGVYERLSSTPSRPSILVATYFGHPKEALPALASTDVEAVALDLVHGPSLDDVRAVPGLLDKHLVLGLVDGRNVWRTDLDAALATARSWVESGASVSVATSCSLLHVPYDLSAETELDPDVAAGLAFGRQKIDEVVALQAALDASGDLGALRSVFRAAADGRARLHAAARATSGERVEVSDADRTRTPRAARVEVQRQALDLPSLPTTTIGSFPQTAAVRKARADLRRGRIDTETYDELMRSEIADVVRLQEDLGLDVLVHGEPERNDMVQYFAEQLDGYAFTHHAWVQSYGSRCVRPPILFGDVTRPHPMTVEWATYAQSLTDKPVKGMLTGPVTMLAWSFVRDDQPLGVTADQVGLALAEEVRDLEAAGISIIQVDEPALRELLPLRREEQPDYLTWSVDSFRLATAGVRDETQVHTHLCYSEFGEIIEAIDALDADVTSIEAARSGMELLADVAERGFDGGLGPGVYDIHSPRVPSTEEMSQLLRSALKALPSERLWVNPDCGLKTRTYAEVEPALRGMVEAARSVRA